MSTTVKVQDLTDLGVITAGDKLVGERVDGTTSRITYSDIGSTARTTVGTLTTGVWNATTIAPSYGGTGIASYTTNSMVYATGATTLSQLTAVANAVLSYNGSGVPSASTTLPSGLTIPGYQATLTPAALTKVDDTNVTLTLGGTPTTALLQASSLTLGWTGQLGLTRGGTAASLTASNGGVVYSTASALAVLSGTATASKMLLSGSSAAPTWSAYTLPSSAGSSGVLLRSNGTNFATTTSTFADTYTTNSILYSNGANSVTGLTTTNSAILQTDGIGNISWGTFTGSGSPVKNTSPSLVTPLLGTPTSGTLTNCTGYPSTALTGQITVPLGGTGNSTFTAYSVICAGTTATGIFQNVSGVGTSGQFLQSQGASALPQWATANGRLLSLVVLTTGSAATYTPSSASVKNIFVEVIGGGGAGGGCFSAGAGAFSAAGGGGGGGYSSRFITNLAVSYTATYTVGAGGASSAAGNNPGGNGAATTFADGTFTLSGGGGTGGSGNGGAVVMNIVAGGAPGTSSGGTLNTSGAAGCPGIALSILAVAGGNGGGSALYGGGALGIVNGSTTGNSGGIYGNGGSGCAILNANDNKAGGAGGAGVLIIREYS